MTLGTLQDFAETPRNDLPLVNGRHQNRALANARKQRAIELKTQGLTYKQIAERMGYKSAGTVCNIVRTAQAKQLTEAVEDHRATELARLEAMHQAVWEQATAGDVGAVLACLKILDRRLRLLGLDTGKDAKVGQDVCGMPPTVVVRDGDCRHRGCPVHGSLG